MSFTSYVRLLALAHKPQGCASILAWPPFARDTLGRIIDDHNTRCFQFFRGLGMLDEDIQKLGKGVTIVPHDLSTVTALSTADFADIFILLVDVEAADSGAVGKIKTQMARNVHGYHLLQVSRNANSVSCQVLFQPLPVIPSNPEILLTQEDLERHLRDFSEIYVIARTSIGTPWFTVGNDPEDRKIMQAYIQAVPTIAGQVRDTAMARGLSKENIRAFAPQAAMQEFFLARLAEQFRTPHTDHIVLAAIRERLAETTTQAQPLRLRLEPVGLVMCNLTRPMRELTIEQRDIAIDLGIGGKGFGTIQLDEPTVRAKVSTLGDALEVKKLSAELPSGFFA